MAEGAAPLVAVSGLSKEFAGKRVLDGVDLSLRRGRAHAVVGPSSAGKTVLLKCILGLYRPDGGTVSFDGRPADELDRAERDRLADRLGVVFQRNALFDSLPVWENVAFRLLQRRGRDRQEVRRLAIEKLALFGLAERVADRYPAELSGGMQKRVALARAFATDPDVLLLDAPTDGLDPILTRRSNELIRAQAVEQDTTILAVVTDMPAALEYFDDITMLHEGRLVWSGTTADAREADEPRLRQLLAGSSEGPIRMAVRT